MFKELRVSINMKILKIVTAFIITLDDAVKASEEIKREILRRSRLKNHFSQITSIYRKFPVLRIRYRYYEPSFTVRN